ncbi:diguanylate cyclase domain-containing protein [uncultured Clostridium sp.]|uniref:GGDEF domain-containing response regulator n=1 Tax=uncultured Clostridium sp. TaxID=59620 RepID=UPI0026F27506|nr:diguanylate cyclase [uncultured Clostridium sp.]
MVQEIYLIDNNNELIEKLNESFKRELNEYKFKSVKATEIEVALRNIPSLIIVDEDTANVNIVEFCKSIRSNEDNSITPIIVVSSNRNKEHIVEILKTDVEYYIKKPIDEEYFYYTIKNIVGLLTKNRRISPLTGLPGNVQIQAEMKKRLLNKETFAILYFDLDNFKAYNDVYGFANGDEIIKFTARTITKHIHQIPNSDNFVGHIGGDDFVAIINQTDYDLICQNIILEFDKYTVDFYNEIDVERGYVEVANRRGIIEQFPLTSISIAVLEVDSKIYKTTLEIGEMAGQIKHQAKTIPGSTYVINRRRF